MDSQFIQDFVKKASLEFQKIVIRITEIMGASDEELNCAIKWGQLTYAKNADFHHWIVGIKVTKKFVGLVFHDSASCASSSATERMFTFFTALMHVPRTDETRRDHCSGIA